MPAIGISARRLGVLVFGPIPIVVLSVALARWTKSDPPIEMTGNHVVTAQVHVSDRREPPRRSESTAQDRELLRACHASATELRRCLEDSYDVTVHPPFVIGGSIGKEAIHDWYIGTIEPSARAMTASYFEFRPNEPITVMLLDGEAEFRAIAESVFGDTQISRFGYYKPDERALVVNIATGGGTLVHELTHALIDFDFPEVPHWFNEGLASLHEESRIRSDYSGIDGLPNWRLDVLRRSIRQGTWRPMQAMVSDDDFRGAREGTNYAQARYFCLYLQTRGELEPFYRAYRDASDSEARAEQALATVIPGFEWATFDAEFRGWLSTQER